MTALNNAAFGAAGSTLSYSTISSQISSFETDSVQENETNLSSGVLESNLSTELTTQTSNLTTELCQ